MTSLLRHPELIPSLFAEPAADVRCAEPARSTPGSLGAVAVWAALVVAVKHAAIGFGSALDLVRLHAG